MQLALSLSLAAAAGASLLFHSRGHATVQPKGLQSGGGRAAVVLLSQPVLGCDVVFSVLGGSTSGGSCSWRNLFCFVPCFHALSLSPLLMKAEKSDV